MIPHAMENAVITHKSGAKVPLDIEYTNHEGKIVRLADEMNDKPLVLTLGYYGCPMLCNLVLNGVVEVLKASKYTLGKDYDVASFSIDHREGFELAAKKRENYLASFPKEKKQYDAWSFNVMSEKEARRLADSVGFGYSYDKKTDEYAHGAGFFILTPDGVLSKTLFGIAFEPSQFNMALMDSSEGKIGSLVDRILLSCFHYDPDAHRYGVYIFGVMRLGGLITVIIMAMFLAIHFRKERKMYGANS